MKAHIDDDRTPMLLGLHSGFLVIGFIAVALRFGSRIKIGAKLGVDDWLIFAAVVRIRIFAHSPICLLDAGAACHHLHETSMNGCCACPKAV